MGVGSGEGLSNGALIRATGSRDDLCVALVMAAAGTLARRARRRSGGGGVLFAAG